MNIIEQIELKEESKRKVLNKKFLCLESVYITSKQDDFSIILIQPSVRAAKSVIF